MKTYNLILLVIGTFYFTGCTKQATKEFIESIEGSNPLSFIVPQRVLFVACWDNWKRTINNCESGFGLCNFESCWGWQDPCCEFAMMQEDPPSGGTIYYDSIGNVFGMIIQLNPNNTIENSAIQSRLSLEIDTDIQAQSIDPTWDIVTLVAG